MHVLHTILTVIGTTVSILFAFGLIAAIILSVVMVIYARKYKDDE